MKRTSTLLLPIEAAQILGIVVSCPRLNGRGEYLDARIAVPNAQGHLLEDGLEQGPVELRAWLIADLDGGAQPLAA